MAQLVEHHLAKVRVAGSNPVVRSEGPIEASLGGVAERRGNGLQSRVHGFKSRLHLDSSRHTSGTTRAIGAAVARFPDTEEVTGSIPVSPTTRRQQRPVPSPGGGALRRSAVPHSAFGHSAFDDVVDWRDHRLAGVDADAGQDRDERRPEGLELLLRLPDVEHLDVALDLHGHVVQPSVGRADPRGVELLDSNTYSSQRRLLMQLRLLLRPG